MKKIKSIMLGAGLLIGLTAVASCSSQENIVHIDMEEEEDEYTFSSITLDTTNVKKVFYLGDSFSYEGLIVKANHTRPINEDETEAVSEEISTFTVDTEFVDMTTTGTYVVYVKGRSGMETKSAFYTITVVTSVQAETGKEYMAGLEVTMASTSKGYINNHTIQLQQDEELTLPQIASFNRVMFIGTDLSDKKTVNEQAVKVDSSAVNMSKKGSYPIIYSYERDGVTVKSFILVIVSNPVTGVKFVSGNIEQSASVNGFDYSDWKFELTEESGSKSEMTYNDDYFSVTGVNSYVAGNYTAVVKYTDDDGSFDVEVGVTVLEATGFNIVIESDLSATSGVAVDNRVKIGDTNYFHYTAGSGDACETRETKFDNLTFGNRLKLNGAGSISARNIEIYMPNAGQIVAYFGTSSSGTVRTIECASSDGEVIASASSGMTTAKAVFNISEAGTYHLYSTGSSIYAYGFIIAYEKEGAVEPDPAGITGLEFESGIINYIQNGSLDGLDTIKVKASFDDNTTKTYTQEDDEITITGFDNTKVGHQTITITFDDGYTNKSVDVTVNVTNVTLESIEYVSGTKTQRASMGTFNVSDFVLKATYSDASTKELRFNTKDADYTLTYTGECQTLGQKTMTVTFVDNTLETKSCDIDMNVIKMSSENISLNSSYIDSLPKVESTDLPNDLGNGFSVPMGTSDTTNSKSNTVREESNKELNGFEFTHRLSLKTKGNDKHNNINFEAKAGAKVVVYALASSGGKNLYLSNDGTAIYKNVSYPISTEAVTAYEFTIEEDGRYYLLANNAAYIFYVGVEHDSLASTDEASLESIELYSPIGVNNSITIKVGSSFDVNSIKLVGTYSDDAKTYLSIAKATVTENTVNVSSAGTYRISANYEGIDIVITVNVVVETSN